MSVQFCVRIGWFDVDVQELALGLCRHHLVEDRTGNIVILIHTVLELYL